MNTENLISLIIPIYNVEKYLDRCIESVVGQTYRNLEIILIDDGSLDNCPKICDEWAKKDCRIKVIHKRNGGLSEARNVGLDICLGNYIMFLDSDDYIDKHICEDMIRLITEHDADVVIGDFIRFNEGSEPVNNSKNTAIEFYDDSNKFTLLKYHHVETVVAWGKLYKKEVFHNIRYPVGKIHEDEFVVHRYLWNSHKIIKTNKPYYFYLQRSGSITNSGFNEKKLNTFEAFKQRMEFLKTVGANKKDIGMSLGSCLSGMINHIKMARGKKELQIIMLNEYREIFSQNKQYFKYIKLKTKIKMVLFKIFPFLFK